MNDSYTAGFLIFIAIMFHACMTSTAIQSVRVNVECPQHY